MNRPAAFVLLCCLGGCSVYTSEPMAYASDADGLHYALPIRLVTLDVDDDSVITLDRYVPVPDPDHHYILTLGGHPLWSDTVGATTTPEGLLSTVSTTTADRTAAIVIEVADAIAHVAAGIPPRALPKAPKAAPFSMTIDPTVAADREAFSAALVRHGHAPRALVCVRVPSAALPSPDPSAPARSGAGVYYRPVLHYRLTFSTIEADEATVVAVIPLLLTQGAPILRFDVTRGAFIEKKVDLTFSAGLLTGISIKKPSEVAALIDIPIGIARTLLTLPAEVLTIRIDDAEDRTDYAEALLALMEAQAALRAAHAAER